MFLLVLSFQNGCAGMLIMTNDGEKCIGTQPCTLGNCCYLNGVEGICDFVSGDLQCIPTTNCFHGHDCKYAEGVPGKCYDNKCIRVGCEYVSQTCFGFPKPGECVAHTCPLGDVLCNLLNKYNPQFLSSSNSKLYCRQSSLDDSHCSAVGQRCYYKGASGWCGLKPEGMLCIADLIPCPSTANSGDTCKTFLFDGICVQRGNKKFCERIAVDDCTLEDVDNNAPCINMGQSGHCINDTETGQPTCQIDSVPCLSNCQSSCLYNGSQGTCVGGPDSFQCVTLLEDTNCATATEYDTCVISGQTGMCDGQPNAAMSCVPDVVPCQAGLIGQLCISHLNQKGICSGNPLNFFCKTFANSPCTRVGQTCMKDGDSGHCTILDEDLVCLVDDFPCQCWTQDKCHHNGHQGYCKPTPNEHFCIIEEIIEGALMELKPTCGPNSRTCFVNGHPGACLLTAASQTVQCVMDYVACKGKSAGDNCTTQLYSGQCVRVGFFLYCDIINDVECHSANQYCIEANKTGVCNDSLACDLDTVPCTSNQGTCVRSLDLNDNGTIANYTGCCDGSSTHYFCHVVTGLTCDGSNYYCIEKGQSGICTLGSDPQCAVDDTPCTADNIGMFCTHSGFPGVCSGDPTFYFCRAVLNLPCDILDGPCLQTGLSCACKKINGLIQAVLDIVPCLHYLQPYCEDSTGRPGFCTGTNESYHCQCNTKPEESVCSKCDDFCHRDGQPGVCHRDHDGLSCVISETICSFLNLGKPCQTSHYSGFCGRQGSHYMCMALDAPVCFTPDDDGKYCMDIDQDHVVHGTGRCLNRTCVHDLVSCTSNQGSCVNSDNITGQCVGTPDNYRCQVWAFTLCSEIDQPCVYAGKSGHCAAINQVLQCIPELNETHCCKADTIGRPCSSSGIAGTCVGEALNFFCHPTINKTCEILGGPCLINGYSGRCVNFNNTLSCALDEKPCLWRWQDRCVREGVAGWCRDEADHFYCDIDETQIPNPNECASGQRYCTYQGMPGLCHKNDNVYTCVADLVACSAALGKKLGDSCNTLLYRGICVRYGTNVFCEELKNTECEVLNQPCFSQSQSGHCVVAPDDPESFICQVDETPCLCRTGQCATGGLIGQCAGDANDYFCNTVVETACRFKEDYCVTEGRSGVCTLEPEETTLTCVEDDIPCMGGTIGQRCITQGWPGVCVGTPDNFFCKTLVDTVCTERGEACLLSGESGHCQVTGDKIQCIVDDEPCRSHTQKKCSHGGHEGHCNNVPGEHFCVIETIGCLINEIFCKIDGHSGTCQVIKGLAQCIKDTVDCFTASEGAKCASGDFVGLCLTIDGRRQCASTQTTNCTYTGEPCLNGGKSGICSGAGTDQCVLDTVPCRCGSGTCRRGDNVGLCKPFRNIYFCDVVVTVECGQHEGDLCVVGGQTGVCKFNDTYSMQCVQDTIPCNSSSLGRICLSQKMPGKCSGCADEFYCKTFITTGCFQEGAACLQNGQSGHCEYHNISRLVCIPDQCPCEWSGQGICKFWGIPGLCSTELNRYFCLANTRSPNLNSPPNCTNTSNCTDINVTQQCPYPGASCIKYGKSGRCNATKDCVVDTKPCECPNGTCVSVGRIGQCKGTNMQNFYCDTNGSITTNCTTLGQACINQSQSGHCTVYQDQMFCGVDQVPCESSTQTSCVIQGVTGYCTGSSSNYRCVLPQNVACQDGSVYCVLNDKSGTCNAGQCVVDTVACTNASQNSCRIGQFSGTCKPLGSAYYCDTEPCTGKADGVACSTFLIPQGYCKSQTCRPNVCEVQNEICLTATGLLGSCKTVSGQLKCLSTICSSTELCITQLGQIGLCNAGTCGALMTQSACQNSCLSCAKEPITGQHFCSVAKNSRCSGPNDDRLCNQDDIDSKCVVVGSSEQCTLAENHCGMCPGECWKVGQHHRCVKTQCSDKIHCPHKLQCHGSNSKAVTFVSHVLCKLLCDTTCVETTVHSMNSGQFQRQSVYVCSADVVVPPPTCKHGWCEGSRCHDKTGCCIIGHHDSPKEKERCKINCFNHECQKKQFTYFGFDELPELNKESWYCPPTVSTRHIIFKKSPIAHKVNEKLSYEFCDGFTADAQGKCLYYQGVAQTGALHSLKATPLDECNGVCGKPCEFRTQAKRYVYDIDDQTFDLEYLSDVYVCPSSAMSFSNQVEFRPDSAISSALMWGLIGGAIALVIIGSSVGIALCVRNKRSKAPDSAQTKPSAETSTAKNMKSP